MIYLAGFYFSFMGVLGTIVYLQGRKDRKAAEIEQRRKDLKVARFQKKIDSWNYANEILSKIEIESE